MFAPLRIRLVKAIGFFPRLKDWITLTSYTLIFVKKIFIRRLAVRTGEEKKNRSSRRCFKSNMHKGEINIFLSASRSVTSAHSNMGFHPVTQAETCTLSHSASGIRQSSVHLKSILSTPLPCLRPCSPARLNRPPTQRTLQTGAIERLKGYRLAHFKIGFKMQLLQLPQLSDLSQEEEGKPAKQKLP